MKKYTMIEILIVISIIIILASMTMAGAGYLQRKAANDKTWAQIKLIESALQQHKTEYGYYPQQINCESLKALWFSEPNGLKKANKKLILDWVGSGNNVSSGNCLDAFDEPLYYQCPGAMNKESYDLFSKGYDTKFGDGGSVEADAQTMKQTDDINNWSRQ